MLLCAEKFKDRLERAVLSYKILRDKEDSVVFSVPHKGRNYFCFFSGEDGKNLSITVIWCQDIPEERLPKAYICANEINSKYKWVKLFVDADNNLVASSDTVLAPSTAAEYASELLVDRLIGILEDNEEFIEKTVKG